MNYFQEEMGDSVSVEIVEFSSGKDVNTALAAGSIDFGLEGSCPASLAIAQDLGVELIWIHEVWVMWNPLLQQAHQGLIP